MDRKIIFECTVGSKLYGTNRPDSDDDFMGVFLPSTEDMLSLTKGPDELSFDSKLSSGAKNTVGDTDRKLYRLDKFLSMLANGQSKQLEMLFAPDQSIVTKTPEWDLISTQKKLFLAKTVIVPFSRFAKAQTIKATIKGQNLIQLQSVIDSLEKMKPTQKLEDSLDLRSLVSVIKIDQGVEAVEICGKKYLLGERVKEVVKKLKKNLEEYGPRAYESAKRGYDYRSLSHAYRLLMQATELMSTGEIKFPLGQEATAFLKSVRSGEYKSDYFSELEVMQQKLEQLPTSLPDQVDLGKVNELCVKMMEKHLSGK